METGAQWQLGTPDLVLRTEQPYKLAAGGGDVFWNYLFSTSMPGVRYVRAVEIHPGRERLIHHANLIVDRTGSSRRFEHVPGAGFGGMELAVRRNPLDPESHFLFWKPGSPAAPERQGLPGGSIQVTSWFSTLIFSLPANRKRLHRRSACTSQTSHTRFPILLELQADGKLDIPAGARDFLAEDELTLPVGVRVLAIYPHAHYLGTQLESYADLTDGTREELIHIAHWDLNQQAVYRYREPIALPKGTVVHMRLYYDNSATNIRLSANTSLVLAAEQVVLVKFRKKELRKSAF